MALLILSLVAVGCESQPRTVTSDALGKNPGKMGKSSERPRARGGLLKIKRNREDEGAVDDASPDPSKQVVRNLLTDEKLHDYLLAYQKENSVECLSPRESQIQWACRNNDECGIVLNLMCLERPLDNTVASAATRIRVSGSVNQVAQTYTLDFENARMISLQISETGFKTID